jgi:hypothetical protein
MNVLEIKGSLHEIISQVNDKSLLMKMFESFQDIIRFQDTGNDLTSIQQAELEAAIKQESNKTAAIRERLRLKYVTNGEWEKMDDEERQDASLLEGMLYDKEQPDYETNSETDTKDFYKTLKKELHAL